MRMKFYDALQMDPAVLKGKISACDTKQDKLYYWVAMATRSVLIVAFAIVFISLLWNPRCCDPACHGHYFGCHIWSPFRNHLSPACRNSILA